MSSQFLGSVEVSEILMISINDHWEERSQKELSPLFDGMDDSKEFSIVDLIISFCRAEQLREIEAGVVIAIVVFL